MLARYGHSPSGPLPLRGLWAFARDVGFIGVPARGKAAAEGAALGRGAADLDRIFVLPRIRQLFPGARARRLEVPRVSVLRRART